MKRALIGIILGVAVFAASAVSVCAAGRGCGRRFIGGDGGGICYNTGICQTGAGCGQYYVDEDGDGICDNCGVNPGNCLTGNGCGQYYSDADGDGVCDNYDSGLCGGRRSSSGRGCGSRRGHGCHR